MKERFRKITILAFHKDRDQVMAGLQDLGVIHLELDHSFRNEHIEELEQKMNQLNKALETVREYSRSKPEYNLSVTKEKLSAEQVITRVTHLRQELESIAQQREALRRDKIRRSSWGDFDFAKIVRLAEYNIHIRFCVATKKEFLAYDFGDAACEIIYEAPDNIYFVVIAKGEVPSLPFEMINVPPETVREIEADELNLSQRNTATVEEIRSYSGYLPLLDEELKRIETKLSFVLANGSFIDLAQGSIVYIQGWYPISLEDRILNFVAKEQVVYSIGDPKPGDRVPVLLKNRKYPKFFEHITRIFELPGYYEYDLTPLIAVFYPILFAYCLGDAGYGLVLLIAAVAGLFTFLKSTGSVAVLGIILGAFATVMGIIKSGSIFGIPVTTGDSGPFLQFLSQLVLIPDDRDFIFNAFNVALMIGVVQILVGIVVSILNKIKYHGIAESIAQVGKLFIVTGLIWIFLADMQDMEALASFPLVRKGLLIFGIFLVLLFHDMSMEVVSRIFSGVLPLFFIFTGILSDILSYVRLFALGVASSVLGLVVNQIGMQIMDGSWWSILLGIVFLAFGHSLNFGIALLGSFVHPLRLTFVEFYNNAQFEGGGIPYKPFKKNLTVTKE